MRTNLTIKKEYMIKKLILIVIMTVISFSVQADEKTYTAKVKVTRIYEVGFMSPDAEQAKLDIETLNADGKNYSEA